MKAQQEELEDCYSADGNFVELLDEIQAELYGKEILEEEIFKEIQKSFEANLESMKEQRKHKKLCIATMLIAFICVFAMCGCNGLSNIKNDIIRYSDRKNIE